MYVWQSYNTKTGDEQKGEAQTYIGAQMDAEAAHKAFGAKGVVTKIKSQNGTEYYYVPRERSSGMKWERR